MYYYKVKENKIFKYEVIYDLEKVRELLNDLVMNCSEEKTYHYTSVGIPRRDLNVKYKRFDYMFACMRYDFMVMTKYMKLIQLSWLPLHFMI